MKKLKSSLFVSLVFIIAVTTMQGCKKSSGGGGSSSEYYFTATVSGKAWAANVADNSLHSPAVAGISGSGSAALVLVIGIQAKGKDSSAFVLVFPAGIALNKTTKFDASQYIEAAYALNASGYNTTPQNKGSGNITITSFDDATSIIEGNFSGSFGSPNGTTSLQVTNGKFRCPYMALTGNSSPLPPGVKF